MSRRESLFLVCRRAQLSVCGRLVSILNRRKAFRVQLPSLKSFTINAWPFRWFGPATAYSMDGFSGKLTREPGDCMHTLLQDLRFAIRQLWKSQGFTLAAISSLAIGIGINTAVFSNMDAVVLHPLAVPQLDRVVTVSEQSAHTEPKQRLRLGCSGQLPGLGAPKPLLRVDGCPRPGRHDL